jgi:ubiquinone/menaquinone biosynthesis C-methylase UbiE
MTTKRLSKTKDHLNVISKAYDKTVDNFNEGIEDEDLLPDDFKNSERYKRFKKIISSNPNGSEDSQIFNYLNPKSGMKFLDVGSCANLICKKLHEWPSEYYGIDISPKLIKASQNFVKRNNIKIGGLCVAEVAKMPFENNFFDICAVIGVLEYFDTTYIKKSLKELYRVIKSNGKIVVDMPNLEHPDCKTMIKLEGYLGRTRENIPSNEEFETELKKLFSIEKVNSQIMTSYFARAKK